MESDWHCAAFGVTRRADGRRAIALESVPYEGLRGMRVVRTSRYK